MTGIFADMILKRKLISLLLKKKTNSLSQPAPMYCKYGTINSMRQ